MKQTVTQTSRSEAIEQTIRANRCRLNLFALFTNSERWVESFWNGMYGNLGCLSRPFDSKIRLELPLKNGKDFPNLNG